VKYGSVLVIAQVLSAVHGTNVSMVKALVNMLKRSKREKMIDPKGSMSAMYRSAET
jgi:hypothetical protein